MINLIQNILKKFNIFQKTINDNSPFVYVALGDSTVEGIGASHISKTYPAVIHSALKNSYKNVVFHNLGKSGAKISDTLANQLEPTISSNPQLITISIGAHDIFKRKSLKSFSIDLDILLKELTDKTDATIVINTIPDFSVVPSIPPVLRTYCEIQGKRFNVVIEKLAEKYNLILADLYTHTRVLGKQYPELFSDDGLHPSDIGYAIWAHAILVKIENILKKKTGVAPKTETIINPTTK
jgi:lysophospholipase L1-like esterase